MERTGEVTSVQGEWLEITFCRPGDCEKCHACMGGQKTAALRVKGEARVGDHAVVSMPEATVTKASAIAYLLPLAALMIGMFIGDALSAGSSSVGAIIGGVIGIAVALLIVLLTEGIRRRSPKWQPQLVRVIPARDEAPQP